MNIREIRKALNAGKDVTVVIDKDIIELSIYRDVENDLIVTNLCHFASGDYYKSIDNIIAMLERVYPEIQQ